MRHHTKDKGDMGLGFVMADCLANRVQVCLPVSEHLPFDCVLVGDDNTLLRVQVKYRKAVNGAIDVDLRSAWNDRKGTHVRHPDRQSVDAVAVYCPDLGGCAYIKMTDVPASSRIRLRAAAAVTRKDARPFSDFTNPHRLFQPPPSERV